MDYGLKGRVAIVTGSGSQIGFGKGIAMVLAKEGCDIVVSDINLEGAEKTAAEIKGLGCKAIAVKTDVTSLARANEMVEKAIAEFGKVDILVNNAGGSTPPQPFAETDEADWDKEINLNFRGVLNCTRAVLPHMISRKYGKIVSLSSVAALSGQPSGAIYGAAKAAVITFSQGIAQEVFELGINVNCVAPGLGATGFFNNMGPELNAFLEDMKAAGRIIKPEDIGNAIAFLASDSASKVIGQCLTVRGNS